MNGSFLLALLLLGCSGSEAKYAQTDTGEPPSEPAEPCLVDTMRVELGTGEFAFEPLAAGEPIDVIHGTQDGHHILGSVRIHNVTEIATIHYTITTVETGERISDQVYRLRLEALPGSGGCAGQAVGMYGYLGRIDPGTATFLSKANLMAMTVTNTSGEQAHAEVEVIPRVEAIDHSDDTGMLEP